MQNESWQDNIEQAANNVNELFLIDDELIKDPWIELQPSIDYLKDICITDRVVKTAEATMLYYVCLLTYDNKIYYHKDKEYYKVKSVIINYPVNKDENNSGFIYDIQYAPDVIPFHIYALYLKAFTTVEEAKEHIKYLDRFLEDDYYDCIKLKDNFLEENYFLVNAKDLKNWYLYTLPKWKQNETLREF